jgi:hypothetical protein
MFSSLLMSQEYERLLPDYEAYRERVISPYQPRRLDDTGQLSPDGDI